VHVWRASLDLPASEVHDLHQTPTPDELHRAERFRFRKDRDRFIAARGLLRAILGRYLKADPARLRFSYGPNGKPYLADEISGNDLSFNLSRRDDLALYAITRGREVGASTSSEFATTWNQRR
jgi:4'-phosphopantetheinyl transferase